MVIITLLTILLYSPWSPKLLETIRNKKQMQMLKYDIHIKISMQLHSTHFQASQPASQPARKQASNPTSQQDSQLMLKLTNVLKVDKE
jgi:hypothetical protein